MPIELESPLCAVSQDEFHRIDKSFTGLVFDTHNELGNLCDEKIYQNELLHRCCDAGFETVRKEFRIRVWYRDFEKIYRIDMVLERYVPYELKCVEKLAPAHQTQMLNYLLLAGLNHGKIFNFRPDRVEFRFVSTQLTPERRYEFRIDDDQWRDCDADGAWLKQTVVELLRDCGAFLDFELFYEAVRCFRGGDDAVIRRIEMKNDSRPLGTQRAHLLNPITAFKFSAVTKDVAAFETHLRKFLRLTSLERIQWINFNHHVIEFVTVERE